MYLRPYLYAILATLPFSGAATIPVGVPLKSYEVIGAVALALALANERIRVGPPRRVVQLWLIFLWGSLFSAAIGLFLLDDVYLGAYDWAHGRYQPLVSLVYNISYLAFDIGLLVLFLHALRRGILAAEDMVRWWLYGTILAVAYAVLANLVWSAGLPLSLVLYWSEPQIIELAGRQIVRSGPFVEGNYFGLYICLSCAFALWLLRRDPQRRIARAALPVCVLGAAISGAPLAMVGTGLLIGGTAMRPWFPRKLRGAVAAGLFIVVVAGLGTDLIRLQFVEKLSLVFSGGVADHRNVSLVQRANESYTAWRVFLDHPGGVGVGNFGYFAGFYPQLFDWLPVDFLTVRRIPNNVYLEVFAEQGLILGIVFVVIQGLIVRALWRRGERILLAGLAIMLVYFLAFPTYKVVLLWVAQALLVYVGYGRDEQPSPRAGSGWRHRGG